MALGQDSCELVGTLLALYVDGEFEPTDGATIERHLGHCAFCAKRAASLVSLRKLLRDQLKTEAISDLGRRQIELAVSKEAQRDSRHNRRGQLALVAGAIAAAIFGWVTPYFGGFSVWSSRGTQQASAWGIDPIAALTKDVVAKHQRNLPLEVAGASDQVRRWYAGKVDFVVHPPLFGGAALRGGRIANIGNQPAAYLRYESDGNPISVFIFDGAGTPPLASRFAARQLRVIANRQVLLGQERGYNVALFVDHGISYAIAADLAPERVLELVHSAVAPLDAMLP